MSRADGFDRNSNFASEMFIMHKLLAMLCLTAVWILAALDSSGEP